MFSILRSHGVLGINARNLKFIKPYNPKKTVAFADDKLKTKKYLEARGIPVPKLLSKISRKEELENLDWNRLNSFVIKPNRGYGGDGIQIIAKKTKHGFLKLNGESVSEKNLTEHIADILDGRYSMSSIPDTALIEERVDPHCVFEKFTDRGLPDIRIIVHNLIPVMAMLRVPTHASQGKANLHLGGVGIGLSMDHGETTFAVQYNKIVSSIPEFGNPSGVRIPFWDDMLLIASKIQYITNLGFLGADIAIDKKRGPVLLEINARAGLMVQLANLAPLYKRLEKVKGIKVQTPEKGVRISKEIFSEKHEKIQKEYKEYFSRKKVIGHRENIEIIMKNGKKTVLAKIRSDVEKSAFDINLLKEITKKKSFQDLTKVKFVMLGEKIHTAVLAQDMKEKDYSVVIGRRDLKDFVIDPSFGSPEMRISEKKSHKIDFESIDKRICDIDSKLKILYHIKPSNLESEKKIFKKDNSYNPKFVYPSLKFSPNNLKERLQYIETDSSPLGQLFKKKKEEIIRKINLLDNRGDSEGFTNASVKLYGRPTASLIRISKKAVFKKPEQFFENIEFNSHEAKKEMEDAFKEFGLNSWKVKIKNEMVADMSIGKNKTLYIKENSFFSRPRINSLIAHEIETHIFTAENGEKQPFKTFMRGTADYLTTQEGLACYNQEKYLEKREEKSFFIYLGIIATDLALRYSFSEVYKKILSLGFSENTALNYAVKTKRGLSDTSRPGGFTKNTVYLAGLLKIKEYLKKKKDIRKLYIGKINIDDISLMEKISILKEPKYLPKLLA